jgi:SulP family sulfate permease
LIDTKVPVTLWHKDKADFAMLLTTFLATLTLGIETGIISGMVLSLLMVIHRASRPHMAQLGRVPETPIFRNINRFDHLEIRENILIVRVDGPIYFANVEFIKDKMGKWLQEKEDKTELIVFNMESVTSIDSTGIHELGEWIKTWRARGIDFSITSAKGPVRDVLDRWGLLEEVGHDHMFIDEQTAMEYFDHKLDKGKSDKYSHYATQSNDRK